MVYRIYLFTVHIHRKMLEMLRYRRQRIYFAFSQLSTVNFEIIPYAQYPVVIYREALLQSVVYHSMYIEYATSAAHTKTCIGTRK